MCDGDLRTRVAMHRQHKWSCAVVGNMKIWYVIWVASDVAARHNHNRTCWIERCTHANDLPWTSCKTIQAQQHQQQQQCGNSSIELLSLPSVSHQHWCQMPVFLSLSGICGFFYCTAKVDSPVIIIIILIAKEAAAVTTKSMWAQWHEPLDIHDNNKIGDDCQNQQLPRYSFDQLNR